MEKKMENDMATGIIGFIGGIVGSYWGYMGVIWGISEGGHRGVYRV